MQHKTDKEEHENGQSRLPLYFSILLIAAIITAYFIVPEFNQFARQAYEVLTSDDDAKIEQWVGQYGFWGPFIIILAMVAQMFLLVIPTFLLMVVSVIAFGPVWGTLITLIAVLTASTIGYSIGAYLGPKTVGKLIGGKTEKKLREYVGRYGIWAVIIARIAPFLSNDAVSFVGGLVRMGYWKFIMATLAGITPLALLIAYLGESNDRLVSGLIWVSVVCIIAFALYIVYDQRKKKKKRPEAE